MTLLNPHQHQKWFWGTPLLCGQRLLSAWLVSRLSSRFSQLRPFEWWVWSLDHFQCKHLAASAFSLAFAAADQVEDVLERRDETEALEHVFSETASVMMKFNDVSLLTHCLNDRTLAACNNVRNFAGYVILPFKEPWFHCVVLSMSTFKHFLFLSTFFLLITRQSVKLRLFRYIGALSLKALYVRCNILNFILIQAASCFWDASKL